VVASGYQKMHTGWYVSRYGRGPVYGLSGAGLAFLYVLVGCRLDLGVPQVSLDVGQREFVPAAVSWRSKAGRPEGPQPTSRALGILRKDAA
jgi:hypothetical protein